MTSTDQAVKATLKAKLKRLRADYAQIAGQPFEHFYCPILFKDDDVELCLAHIVPQAFPRSSRAWTVQRKDVDNFFGTNFEEDFLAIQCRIEGQSPDQILADRTLSRRYRPKILADGKPVEYFVTGQGVPPQFSHVELRSDAGSVPLGLKIPPGSAGGAPAEKLEVVVEKDVRISALVALIKAAHLTLFHLLGYRYALSAGGHFVGRQLLGDFFCRNRGKPKSDVDRQAAPFYQESAHMVRAVPSHPGLKGTITDRTVLVCRGGETLVWAFIVLVGTSGILHAVLIPVLDQADAAPMFDRFLRDENERVDVSYCSIGGEFHQVYPVVHSLMWPKAGSI
jgi:hypothetical protein